MWKGQAVIDTECEIQAAGSGGKERKWTVSVGRRRGDWDWVNFWGSCDSVKLEHRYNWVSGFPCPVLNTFLWDEINLTSFVT